MLDALARRIRWAAPRPSGKYVVVDERDQSLFEAINRHGHLPSNYLFHVYGTKNWTSFQKHLTRLYNGAERNGPFLTRPPGQFQGFYAHCQYVVYGLHDNAKARIDPIEHNDPFIHQLMGACFGLSAELTIPGYVPRSEVLKKKDSVMRLPLTNLERKWLVPDDLFGIDYGGTFRFFAVEIDRATESTHRSPSEMRQTSFWTKVEGYKQVLENRTHKDVWGTPNLMPLIVTTSKGRAENLMEEINDPRFIFQVHPTFGDVWQIPLDLLPVSKAVSIRGEFDLTKK